MPLFSSPSADGNLAEWAGLQDSQDRAQDKCAEPIAAVSIFSAQTLAIVIVGVGSRQLKVQRASSLSDLGSFSSSRRLLTSPAVSRPKRCALKWKQSYRACSEMIKDSFV